MQEESRIHQIVKIDIGTALGRRRALNYGRASLLIKEEDVQDDSSLTPVTTTAPSHVSQKWTPYLVRVDYFRKDPYCILERVAAATGTNISVEAANSKDIFVLVSADQPAKVEDALQRLKKLDSLLVRIIDSTLLGQL